MPKVTGISDLKKNLVRIRQFAKQDSESAATAIGYTQTYAIYVHEDLDANHKNGTSAKYLEIPMRQNQSDLAAMVRRVYARTGMLGPALLSATKVLFRLSQQLVPVDTGALKASGYYAMKENEQEAAETAFARSEAIRIAAKGK